MYFDPMIAMKSHGNLAAISSLFRRGARMLSLSQENRILLVLWLRNEIDRKRGFEVPSAMKLCLLTHNGPESFQLFAFVLSGDP